MNDDDLYWSNLVSEYREDLLLDAPLTLAQSEKLMSEALRDGFDDERIASVLDYVATRQALAEVQALSLRSPVRNTPPATNSTPSPAPKLDRGVFRKWGIYAIQALCVAALVFVAVFLQLQLSETRDALGQRFAHSNDLLRSELAKMNESMKLQLEKSEAAFKASAADRLLAMERIRAMTPSPVIPTDFPAYAAAPNASRPSPDVQGPIRSFVPFTIDGQPSVLSPSRYLTEFNTAPWPRPYSPPSIAQYSTSGSGPASVASAPVAPANLSRQSRRLLYFTVKDCKGCEDMRPHVEALIRDDHPIEVIDIHKSPEMANEFRITSVPTLLLLEDGQEIDRLIGYVSGERLRILVDKSKPSPAEADATPATLDLQWVKRVRNATVRVKVECEKELTFGTGTIIDMHEDEALIVTCGHIFREMPAEGKVTVTLYDSAESVSVNGKLLQFDLTRDVGLVAIRTLHKVSPAPIAGAGDTVAVGDRVFRIGCIQGGAPAIHAESVKHVDRYKSPANICVSGVPKDGESGGGLFNSEGVLIGICIATDLKEQAGLFHSVQILHRQLDRLGLGDIYLPAPKWFHGTMLSAPDSRSSTPVPPARSNPVR